ncbi:Tau-tubulin kinase 2 [Toxocara canis]|uniref:Tau-tubulin kinase 2 n=1 Tax=Toxocara canis TaxID=6265 RepID=A0A0B2VF41_TOXCA|nr:Tau-tubulin kinase 2 [Toxocara canis]
MSVDRLPSVCDVVISSKDKSYKLVELIGEGGYGCVFRASTGGDNKFVALKAEKYTKTVLKIEIGVLKVANTRDCKHICVMHDYGHVKQEFMFVVMTLLGPDLNKLRNEQFDRHFTIATVIRVAMQTLNAIEELHNCGFISRDIKPGNFAIGNREENLQKLIFIFDFGLARKYVDRTLNAIEELHNCGFISRDIKPGNFAIGNREENLQKLIFIFDFGLARKYVDRNSNHLPSRGETGWRGTTRYGSLRAHHKQDLSRKDDLESWVYMVVELTKGSLPWRLITDRAVVQKKKEEARKDRGMFFASCPPQYSDFLTMVDKLEFTTTPQYAELYKILDEIMKTNKVRLKSRYDWEREGDTISSVTSSTMRSVVDISPPTSLQAGNEGWDRPTHHDLPP